MMHVISLKALREFWEQYPDAELPLREWYHATRKADWTCFADVRGRYASADLVGHLVVFNIGGNKYRLIVAIHYNRGRVYVRQVLTHKEYDRGHWKQG
jgi:mRNA interferase HigB